MLTSFLLMEEDAERRAAAAHKVLRSLDRFLGVYGADGGCDEGPSYWGRAGASLFECLEQLRQGSDGRVDAFDVPLVAEIGRYIMRAHIDGPYYLNFADGSAKINPPGDVIYRYGRRIGDAAMAAMGAALQPSGNFHVGSVRSESLLRVLPALFDGAERAAAPAAMPHLRDVWLPDLQVMVAREKDAAHGLYLAAKGGHNDESHNHNDVGHFVVYLDGRPMLIDAGVETYTAKTFSPRRYDIWTMQSAYHNLPTIGEVQQAPGRDHAAADARYAMGDDEATLALELAGAYPEEAGIATWRRTCTLSRGASPAVHITDRFRLDRPAPVTMSLLTPCEPEIIDGAILLRDGDTVLRITHAPATVVGVDPLPLTDARMVGSWGAMLYRIRLSVDGPVQEGEWTMTAARG
jgi:hypothetical protein